MKTLALIVFLFIGLQLFPQRNRFDVGAYGGPGTSHLWGNTNVKKYANPMATFAGGLFFQYNFPRIWSIHSDLAFERKGGMSTITYQDLNTNQSGTVTTHFNYNYMILPVLARASFGNKTQFFVNIGPYFGVLLNQHSVSRGTETGRTVTDQTSLSKTGDWGISSGLGVSRKFKPFYSFFAELRNNRGLYNTSALPMASGTLQTNSTCLLFGLIWHLGVNEDKH